jgi:P-type E1-E2 ATPase
MCVQAADFAFGQFRFLVRLLLLHGRQSYLRCREVVLYAFYKNVAYVSCYIFFSFYSGVRWFAALCWRCSRVWW